MIMPNHLHVLIDFAYSSKSVNKIVSNGKRFMAYKIVERLKGRKRSDLLLQLSEVVSQSDKARESFTRYLSGHLIGRELHHSISLTKSYRTYIITLTVAFGNWWKTRLIMFIVQPNSILPESREFIQ